MSVAPTVFLIDDQEAIRHALGELLRVFGYGVRTYETADDFLARYEPQQRGCVVADVRMPGMDGLELQRTLKSTHPQLPIVFITAHGSDEEIRLRALDAGAVDYLLKPLGEEEVLNAVHTALKLA